MALIYGRCDPPPRAQAEWTDGALRLFFQRGWDWNLSHLLSKCTEPTTDNGEGNCTHVERCYLYGNEVKSNNFISIKKSTHIYLSSLYLSLAL